MYYKSISLLCVNIAINVASIGLTNLNRKNSLEEAPLFFLLKGKSLPPTFSFLSRFIVTACVHQCTDFLPRAEVRVGAEGEAVLSWTRRLEVVWRGTSGSRPCCSTSGCTG